MEVWDERLKTMTSLSCNDRALMTQLHERDARGNHGGLDAKWAQGDDDGVQLHEGINVASIWKVKSARAG